MSKLTGSQQMRKIGDMIVKEIGNKDIGFALFVFPFKAPGISNYVSNGNREDMIKALKETVRRFENNEDIKTLEEN